MVQPAPFCGRYVFVGGVHRSGTSLLARLIARHPAVAAMQGTGVPEDEGVFLQGAIPHMARHGTPGRFAFDDAQHMTEDSRFNTLETAMRLAHDWAPHYAPDRPWRLEKSPVNLLRTRLYQQLFPRAHFVMIVRHPMAVARATRKWSDQTLEDLMAHWQVAHERLLADWADLHCALLVRYEDLVQDPGATLGSIRTFLDLGPADLPDEPVRDGNADYPATSEIALPPLAAMLGYGPGMSVHAPSPEFCRCRHYLRKVRDGVLERMPVRACPPAGPVRTLRIAT